MRRREFIAGLAGAVAWPLAARAQQPAVPVVGWLYLGAREELILSAFRQGLSEAGFVERQNVTIEYRFADNQADRLPVLAADLVRRQVAVIAVASNPIAISPAKAATTTIPIVFMCGPDPVTFGLVASLNRPGGNLTGVSLLTGETNTKRFGLLHALVPQVATVAMLLQRRGFFPEEFADVEAAGRRVGVRVVDVWADSDGEFEGAFAAAARQGAGALLVASRVFFIDHRYQLVALAARHRLPAMYTTPEYVETSGLMSYSPSLTDAYRQLGIYTGRVLKGEKPADLPVLLPTNFEFVINLQAAKAQALSCRRRCSPSPTG
jgi:putative ABC transport system substrate-binding protein